MDIEDEFWSNVDKTGDCWLWKGSLDGNGYGLFKYPGYLKRAHRISWAFTNGIIPKGKFICHSCDNPTCVNPEHLFVGSQKDNMRDCAIKNRMNNNSPCGESNGLAKLNDKKVLEIRSLAGKMIKREIAALYGVSLPTIKQIITRKTWKHLPDEQSEGRQYGNN